MLKPFSKTLLARKFFCPLCTSCKHIVRAHTHGYNLEETMPACLLLNLLSKAKRGTEVKFNYTDRHVEFYTVAWIQDWLKFCSTFLNFPVCYKSFLYDKVTSFNKKNVNDS